MGSQGYKAVLQGKELFRKVTTKIFLTERIVTKRLYLKKMVIEFQRDEILGCKNLSEATEIFTNYCLKRGAKVSREEEDCFL